MWPFKPRQPKSTHRVEIVPVVLEKHPNADTLSIVSIGGYKLVVKTEDWVGKDKGAYIQPDSIVPIKPEYAFLWGDKEPTLPRRRITAKKFRGQRSEGLLMPAPRGSKVGDNVAGKMGIERYVSPADRKEAEEAIYKAGWWHRINNRGRKGLSFAGNERGPSIWVPIYDLENWYRYLSMFTPEDEVSITEKIHGCNARFVFSSLDKRMFAGSRQTWKRPFTMLPETSLWRNICVKLHLRQSSKQLAQDDWNLALRANPQIEEFCRTYPNHVLFGEIYGDVQDLKYGHKQGERSFVAFDVFHRGAYWPAELVQTECAEYWIPVVPTLYQGPYTEAALRGCIDGKTSLGTDKGQMREGCVIRMLSVDGRCEERGMPGRKILKAVSSAYLERSSKDEEPPINKRIEEHV